MKPLVKIMMILMITEFSGHRSVFAQNWSLFALDHHTYYLTETYGAEKIFTATTDSSKLSGDTTLIWPQYTDAELSVSGCSDEIEAFVLPSGTAFKFPYIEHIENVNGKVIIDFGVDSWPIHFNAAASVGDTFHLGGFGDDNLYIECIFLGVENVLGLDDSIRKYKVYRDGGVTDLSDQTIVLSKNYGLVAFIDLYHLSYYSEGSTINNYEMIGWKSLMDNAGFQAPDWTEYFPLHTGDILIWDRHIYSNVPMDYLDYHLYFKDSVTGRWDYPDSIVYTFDRWQKDTLGVITFLPAFRQVNKREDMTLLLEGPIDRPKNAVYDPMFYYFEADNVSHWDYLQRIVSGVDTIYKLYNYFGYYFLNPDISCMVYEMADVSFGFGIQTDHGVVSEFRSVGDGNDHTNLIGGIQNGIEWGESDFVTVSINTWSGSQQVLVYPNPTEISVHFKLPSTITQAEIFIYDSQGQLVMDKQITETANQVDVAAFAAGLYFVSLHSASRVFTTTFVKQ